MTTFNPYQSFGYNPLKQSTFDYYQPAQITNSYQPQPQQNILADSGGGSTASSGSGGDMFSSLGSLLTAASPYAPIIGSGLSFLSNLFDDSKQKELALKQQQVDLQKDQLAENKNTNVRDFGFKALNELASQRAEAAQLARRYNMGNYYQGGK